jgi:hypothetical protein
MNTDWHFPIMIFASLIVFFIVIRIVLPKHEFFQKKYTIALLAIWVVIVGMLFGKYGASWGLKWWIYYTIPMLMTVFLPPAVLKLKSTKIIKYLILSFLSAPFIHLFFSFLFGWTEYMPFWKIPTMQILYH